MAEPITFVKAYEYLIHKTPNEFTDGIGKARKGEARKRIDELAEDGISIQGKVKRFYTWTDVLNAIAHIENLQTEIITWSDTQIGEAKAITRGKTEKIQEEWRDGTWKNLSEQIGRWERMQEGWNNFWEEAGETVGGATKGLTKGLFKGVGGGKILLVGGLLVVGVILFASSGRGQKTASTVGTATGGVR